MRFYKPVDTQYQDTFVPTNMPWDLVLGAVGKEQATYDKAKADAENTAFNLQNFHLDEQDARAKEAEYNNKVQDLVNQVQNGDYRTASQKLSKLSKDWLADSEVRRITENKIEAEKTLKARADLAAKGLEDADVYNPFGAWTPGSKYKYRAEEDFIYGRQVQDYATAAQKDINNIAADLRGSDTPRYDAEGNIVGWVKSTTGGVSGTKVDNVARQLTDANYLDPNRFQYLADKTFGKPVNLQNLNLDEKKKLYTEVYNLYKKNAFKQIGIQHQEDFTPAAKGKGSGSGDGTDTNTNLNKYKEVVQNVNANGGVGQTQPAVAAALANAVVDPEHKGYYKYTVPATGVIGSFGKGFSKQELQDSKTLETYENYKKSVLGAKGLSKDAHELLNDESVNSTPESKDILLAGISGLTKSEGTPFYGKTIRRNTRLDEIGHPELKGKKDNYYTDGYIVTDNKTGKTEKMSYEDAFNKYKKYDQDITDFKTDAKLNGLDISDENIAAVLDRKKHTKLSEQEIVDKYNKVYDKLAGASIDIIPESQSNVIADNNGSLHIAATTKPMSDYELSALGLDGEDLVKAGLATKVAMKDKTGTKTTNAKGYQMKMYLPVKGDINDVTESANFAAYDKDKFTKESLNLAKAENNQIELSKRIDSEYHNRLRASSESKPASDKNYKNIIADLNNAGQPEKEHTRLLDAINKAHQTRNYTTLNKIGMLLKYGENQYIATFGKKDYENLIQGI